MAKAAISQEEIQLRKRARRRLVGASFLVLLMIIVLPVILDSEPRPQAESVRVQMPVPVREGQSLPEVPATPSTRVDANEASVAEHVEEVTPPAAESQGDEVAIDQVAVTAAEEPSLVIQLGAFSNPENARQLQDALLSEGINAFAEVVKSGESSKTRVRAGPFDSLAEAEQIRDRIAKMKLKLGMEPKIAARGQ